MVETSVKPELRTKFTWAESVVRLPDNGVKDKYSVYSMFLGMSGI